MQPGNRENGSMDRFYFPCMMEGKYFSYVLINFSGMELLLNDTIFQLWRTKIASALKDLNDEMIACTWHWLLNKDISLWNDCLINHIAPIT